MISDTKSPITYGYEEKDLPIYFNQDPVFATGLGSFAASFSGRGAQTYGQNVTPNATPVPISPYRPEDAPAKPKGEQQSGDDAETARQLTRAFGDTDQVRPRVLLQFPAKSDDMLLSGMLAGGQALANKPLALDVPLGKGHIVMFALRPFWRWQTQGTYFLGFNAILNWNDLDAGKPERKTEHQSTDASN
jgi:hypothetical protein